MTTTVSLAARDFIVIGCDSLATTSMDLLFPLQIAQDFFDESGELKLGTDGKPLLKHDRLWGKTVSMPVNQLPSVTKLYDLKPAKAALLFAGASRIGETTIKNLVETFVSDKNFRDIVAKTGEIEEISNCLKDFILAVYEREIPDEIARPTMEILVSGYSSSFREPEVWRLVFYYDNVEAKFGCSVEPEIKRKTYSVVFGGQYDVIQRVVNGVDLASYQGLAARAKEVLEECHTEIENQLRTSGYRGPLPKPNFDEEKFDLFSKNWGNVNRMFSDIGSLSEQAGINFVYFLINIMTNSQEFSNSIPTVGGKVHIAMLTKNDGFKWMSKEGFTFEGEHVPKFV